MLYPISEVRRLVNRLNHPEGLAVARDGSIYAGGEAGEGGPETLEPECADEEQRADGDEWKAGIADQQVAAEQDQK